MKNIIQYIGLTVLILFSFFYTEKTIITIKNQDPLMIHLENIKSEYKIDAVNATISDTNIIPGLKGCKIDIEKSYRNLKRLGEFNSNLLEYVISTPKISINQNYDKYITSGNKTKNTISLIFKVKEKSNIDETINILNKNKIAGTFFMDGKYIENNIKKVEQIIKLGHEVLNYGYDNKYDKDLIIWNNNLLERINYNNPKFCYLEKEDINVLNLCSNNKMHTVMPNIIIKKNSLLEIKSNIEKGSLISFNINDFTTNELNLVINYILQKGYNIDTVSNHLSEISSNNCKKCKSCD